MAHWRKEEYLKIWMIDLGLSNVKFSRQIFEYDKSRKRQYSWQFLCPCNDTTDGVLTIVWFSRCISHSLSLHLEPNPSLPWRNLIQIAQPHLYVLCLYNATSFQTGFLSLMFALLFWVWLRFQRSAQSTPVNSSEKFCNFHLLMSRTDLLPINWWPAKILTVKPNKSGV